jgi:hypothetical protein
MMSFKSESEAYPSGVHKKRDLLKLLRCIDLCLLPQTIYLLLRSTVEYQHGSCGLIEFLVRASTTFSRYGCNSDSTVECGCKGDVPLYQQTRR